MDQNDASIFSPGAMHVLHLFLEVDHSSWDLLDARQKVEAMTALTALAADIRALPDTQLFSFSMVSPKADLGFLLITPDLQECDRLSKRLAISLGPDNLAPAFSWLSLSLNNAHEGPVETFAGWPVFCFFPVAVRRGSGPDGRDAVKEGLRQATVPFGGKVTSFITESAGLEQGDWGATFFSRSAKDLNEVVASLKSSDSLNVMADFGEVYVGIQLPLDALFRRLKL